MQRLSYTDIARILGTGLISAGLGLLGFVAITVVWGDPFTRFQEAAAQDTLEQELVASFDTAAGAGDPRAVALDPDLTRASALRYRRTLADGDAAGRLRIPAIGLDKVVVEGTTEEDLTKGPGAYPETNLPGTGQPVAIAGHRTTYGAPFLDIDQLAGGDEIIMELPYGTFTYTVTRQRIIEPTDWSIINVGEAEPTEALRQRAQQTGTCPSGTCEFIVLTACHPKYSAAQRIAVFARLTSVQLRGGA